MKTKAKVLISSALCQKHSGLVVLTLTDASNELRNEKLAAELTQEIHWMQKVVEDVQASVNIIETANKVLKQQLPPTSESQPHLSLSISSAYIITQLLEQLSQLRKLNATNPSKIAIRPQFFNFRESIVILFNHFRVQAEEKGLDMMFNIASEVPKRVVTDQSKLELVIFTLLQNALKATEEGSIGLNIELPKTNLGDGGALGSDFEEVELYISVKDTGPGLSDSAQVDLFHMLERSKVDKQAGCKGLQLCSQIVR